MNSLRSPLHIPLAIRRFALQWVLTACGSLVLLHTLAPSSLAATPSPQTHSRCSLRSRIDYWGAAAAKCYCSPAGRCGPIRLSRFLHPPCLLCRMSTLRDGHTATKPHASVAPSLQFAPILQCQFASKCHIATFRSVATLAFPAQRQKTRQPGRCGRRLPPSFFGLSAATTLAPLAGGSLLSGSME